MSPLSALLLGWVITALWPILSKLGVERFSPVLFAECGLIVGLLALSPWLAREGRWRRILGGGLRGPLFAMGLFGSGLSSYLFIAAVQYTTPANAAIMAQIEVIYSALLCAWLLGEHISLSQGLGSLLVMGGTGLIMGHDLSTSRWKGDLMILLTPWMYQVSHIYANRLPPDMDAVTISGARAFYGALSLLPFAAWTIAHGPRWSADGGGLAIVLAQGLLLNSASLILWYLAIRRMDLAKATAIMLSYPALTVLFSWALGREKIQAVQLAGLLLTMGGATWVSLLVIKSRRAAHSVVGI